MVKWELADSDTLITGWWRGMWHAACGMCPTKRLAYIWNCHICGMTLKYVKCGPQSAIETIFTHAWRYIYIHIPYIVCSILCMLFISAAGPWTPCRLLGPSSQVIEPFARHEPDKWMDGWVRHGIDSGSRVPLQLTQQSQQSQDSSPQSRILTGAKPD